MKSAPRGLVLISSVSLLVIGVGVAVWLDGLPGRSVIKEAPSSQKTEVGREEGESEHPSASGTEEKPRAFFRYQLRRLRDPETDRIPPDIRQKELNLAETLPSSPQPKSANGEWSFEGPSDQGGRTRALAIDWRDGSTIVAGGVTGGIWRSTDGGQTWTRTSTLTQWPFIKTITQDPRPGHGNEWYAGIGRGGSVLASGGSGIGGYGEGIYKSTDGGRSWSLLPSTVDTSSTVETRNNEGFERVQDVVVDPSNEANTEIYAAVHNCCDQGVHRSTDGGSSWTRVIDTTYDYGIGRPKDLAITSAGTVYATFAPPGTDDEEPRGIYRSPDGKDWTDITPEEWPAPDNGEHATMAIDPKDESTLWTFMFSSEASGPGEGQFGHELWAYDDETGTWTEYTDYIPDSYSSQAAWDIEVSAHPSQDSLLYLGGVRLWRVDLSKPPSTAPTQLESPGVDHHAMKFPPSNAGKMYVGNDFGVHSLSNNREDGEARSDWTSRNAGYRTTQFYSACLNADPTDPTIAGGMQDTESQSTQLESPADDWTVEEGGDGFGCAIANNLTSTGSSRYFSTLGADIFRRVYDENGAFVKQQRVTPNEAFSHWRFNHPFALDPATPNVMYYPSEGTIFRNGNLEVESPRENWVQLDSTDINTPSEDGVSISALGVSRRNNAHVLYFGGVTRASGEYRTRLYRLDNARTASPSTFPVEVTSDKFPDTGHLSSITVDPSDSDRVLAVFSNYGSKNLFFSRDAGATWSHVSGNLEPTSDGTWKPQGPAVFWATILPQPGLDQTTYLVGTTIGVYSTITLDGSNTNWSQEAPSTIGNAVVNMVRARVADGRVLAATHGNGMYSMKLQKPVPPAPADLRASRNSDGDGIKLRWLREAPADLSEYRIYRDTAPIGDEAGGLSPVGTADPSARSFIDASAVSGQTYYYRVQAVDADGNESPLSPEVEVFVNPQEVVAEVSRSFGDASGTGDYRLVALPGQADRPIGDAVSGEAGRQWQAYYDDGSETDYLIGFDGSETFTFQKGKGFWLTVTSEWTFEESVPTADLRGDSATAIGLREGWNVISNPLGKDVAWASVEAASGESLQPIWGFEGSFTEPDTFRSARSGTAYYFFNDSSERDSLVIPYPGAPGSGNTVPKSNGESSDKEAPMLAMTAAPIRPEDAAGSTVRVGIGKEAERGLGPEDLIAPPGRFEQTSLRIGAPKAAPSSENSDRADRTGLLMAERRPPTEEAEGHTFRLRLTSTAEGPVELTAEDLEAVEGRSVALLHPSTGETYDLREEQVVTIEPEGEATKLKLAVGTESYVESAESKVLPSKVSLTSYPNPIGQQGTIEYALPEEVEVTLRVYDVLGREVATLQQGRKKAGRHTVRLEANQLSSGVYFGRLTANGRTLTQKITVVR